MSQGQLRNQEHRVPEQDLKLGHQTGLVSVSLAASYSILLISLKRATIRDRQPS